MTATGTDKPDVAVGEALGTSENLDLLLFMFSRFMLSTKPHASEAFGAGDALILPRGVRKSTTLDTEFLNYGTLMMGSPFLLLLWCRELFT